MLELLITMVERVGIIVTIALIFTRFKFFKEMVHEDRLHPQQQLKAVLFFGFFGIIGTYTGLRLNVDSLHFNPWISEIAVNEAIVNSRVIGVVLAGLLGGYKIGIGAGVIAGLHRFTLGGFTAFSCGLSTIISGAIAGFFHKKSDQLNLRTALLIGVFAETLQMGIILLLSRPFEQAWALVQMIGLPMIISNGLGCALFLLIIKIVIDENDKAGAVEAQKTLRIADKTLAYLRNGLNYNSAKEVCQIIQREINSSAVAISNTKEILAHIGEGDEHHHSNEPIKHKAILKAISKNMIIVANEQTTACQNKHCPLHAAIIAPLKQRGKTIGSLVFYYRSEKEITNVDMELISGLSSMMSTQLEIADADRAYQLAKEAEIKALQAQISPHFLFNTLNTTISLIRINPTKARKLLVSLAHYLRQNLSVTTQTLTMLEQELNHVKAYLSIEEARFISKLEIIYDIDERVFSKEIPPLILQPLVENAIKHGFKNKETDCVIKIAIKQDGDTTHISVEDNGEGMIQERAEQIDMPHSDSERGSGLALYNVNRRLTMMFGDNAGLRIMSEPNKGTKISFSI